MFGRKTAIQRVDEDTLSAIWVLSCLDEDPILTFAGIANRTGLSDEEARKLVASRREMFRPGVSEKRLAAWKDKLRLGKSRAAWVLEIGDVERQNSAIDAISTRDVFRNQFRVNADAPKCSVEIINWGLNHLDLIRKSGATFRDERQRRWGAVVLPTVAILSTLLISLISQTLQWKISDNQRAQKYYEVNFKPKQESYAAFFSAFNEAANACASADEPRALAQINKMEVAYYSLDPFFDDDARKAIFSRFVEFTNVCAVQARKPALIGADWKDVDRDAHQKLVGDIALLKYFFRERMLRVLFANDSQ
jgi:hypothetical protein